MIRLRVRVAQGNKAKGVPRKRFFLIKGSLDENRSWIESLESQTVISRDCYYKSKGASEQLIAWLKENDCESVYCRELESKDLEGAQLVPEFQKAAVAGEKEFGNRELARKWATVNIPNDLRSGFYKSQRDRLQAFLSEAEKRTQTKVLSVMTDRNGTAYFTDIVPGKYVISNILPIEIEDRSSLWNCEITVKPGDLASEKPFLISNPGNKDPRDVRNIKCVSVEKPLPACQTTARR